MKKISKFFKKTTKSFAKAAIFGLAAVSMVACTNDSGELNKQILIGTTGAIGGGIIGSNVGKGHGRTAATIGGAILGGVLGSEIGSSLDRSDKMYYNKSRVEALELNRSGSSSSWHNPDTGAYGTFTPTRTVEKHGKYCREYTQTVTIGGRTERAYGEACRKADGSWKIKS